MKHKMMSAEQQKMVKNLADEKLFIIFGRNKDRLLTEMIPDSDRMRKWSSICANCGVDANFSKKEKPYCRECHAKME